MLTGWVTAFLVFEFSVTAFHIDMSHVLQKFRIGLLTFQANTSKNFYDLVSSVVAFN
jgi:hypothetical protein